MSAKLTAKPDDWNSRPINHLRIVTRRAGRRIMDNGGESHTHCGAAMSAYDITFRDAVKDPTWIKCDKCRAFVEGRTELKDGAK